MPSETLQDVARAVHDVGLAAWLGGASFGKFALNPSVAAASDPRERGKVANAAWNGYNVVNALGLGSAAAVHVAARNTALKPENLSGRERTLITVQDGLVGTAVTTGVLNGIQGARLARQAPEGAVPIETGTKPSVETPAAAAKIQRSLEILGNVNILTGIALVATNALFDRAAFSRPPAKRVGSSSPGRLGATVAGAVLGNALYQQVSGDQTLPSEGFLPSVLLGASAKKKGGKLALGSKGGKLALGSKGAKKTLSSKGGRKAAGAKLALGSKSGRKAAGAKLALGTKTGRKATKTVGTKKVKSKLPG